MRICVPLTLCCFALTLMLFGCSRGDAPALGTVEGTLTVDGDPAPGVTVTFSPVGKGRASTGSTDADGRYKLTYSMSEHGAMVGAHEITIFMAPLSGADEEALAESGNEGKGLGKRVDKLAGVIKEGLVTEGHNEIDVAFP